MANYQIVEFIEMGAARYPNTKILYTWRFGNSKMK